jgi:hypothetical protein
MVKWISNEWTTTQEGTPKLYSEYEAKALIHLGVRPNTFTQDGIVPNLNKWWSGYDNPNLNPNNIRTAISSSDLIKLKKVYEYLNEAITIRLKHQHGFYFKSEVHYNYVRSLIIGIELIDKNFESRFVHLSPNIDYSQEEDGYLSEGEIQEGEIQETETNNLSIDPELLELLGMDPTDNILAKFEENYKPPPLPDGIEEGPLLEDDIGSPSVPLQLDKDDSDKEDSKDLFNSQDLDPGIDLSKYD